MATARKRGSMKLKTLTSCLGVLLLVSCTTPTVPSIATSSANETAVSQPSATPSEHRIAVRVVSSQAEFYDREMGQRFIPRGPNFLMLAREDGNIVDHLFSPLYYNSPSIDQELKAMRALGYNTVRVA